jgi:hypothetical protein
MRIDSSGNVGIGATTVAGVDSRLRVVGGSDGNTGISMGCTATERPVVGFRVSDNSLRAKIEINDTNGATGDRLGFFVYPNPTVEMMSLRGNGNVGIGTTTGLLDAANRVTVSVNGTSSSALAFGVAGTRRAHIYVDGSEMAIAAGQSGQSQVMTFQVNGSERARIDSVGNVGIGSTAPNAILVLQGVGRVGDVNGNRNTLYLKNSNSSSNQSNFISFGSAGTAVSCFIGNDINADGTLVNQLNIQCGTSGGVYLANGGIAWTSVSDERSKDIIEPIADAANKVSSLRAVIGKYKTDAEGTRRSFLIAQDVQAVLPEAVNIGTDEQQTLGVSYTEVIPLLVASIKELVQRVAALETK